MGNTKNILPAVAAAIFNNKGEVLLQKRNDVNKWCVISGHVEFGETVENAIMREVAEETNVKGKIIRLIGVYSSPSSQTYTYHDREVQYVTTYFQIQLTDDLDLAFSNNETVELKYFKTDQIPSNLARLNPNWLKDALDENGNVFIR